MPSDQPVLQPGMDTPMVQRVISSAPPPMVWTGGPPPPGRPLDAPPEPGSPPAGLSTPQQRRDLLAHIEDVAHSWQADDDPAGLTTAAWNWEITADLLAGTPEEAIALYGSGRSNIMTAAHYAGRGVAAPALLSRARRQLDRATVLDDGEVGAWSTYLRAAADLLGGNPRTALHRVRELPAASRAKMGEGRTGSPFERLITTATQQATRPAALAQDKPGRPGPSEPEM